MCRLRIRVGKIGFWRRFFVVVVALAAFFCGCRGGEGVLGDGIGFAIL